jgi:hypothetical protein
MDEYLLYILPFNNGNHFKFGITRCKNFERIKGLNRKYGIDIDKSFIYRGDKKSIISIETKLKQNEFLQVDDYIGRDGYTEIRNISELKNTMDIVESYKEFNLIKEPLKIYDKYCKVKSYSSKLNSTFNMAFIKIKTSGMELPEANLTSIDIDEIDIPYESTLKSGIFR